MSTCVICERERGIHFLGSHIGGVLLDPPTNNINKLWAGIFFIFCIFRRPPLYSAVSKEIVWLLGEFGVWLLWLLFMIIIPGISEHLNSWPEWKFACPSSSHFLIEFKLLFFCPGSSVFFCFSSCPKESLNNKAKADELTARSLGTPVVLPISSCSNPPPGHSSAYIRLVSCAVCSLFSAAATVCGPVYFDFNNVSNTPRKAHNQTQHIDTVCIERIIINAVRGLSVSVASGWRTGGSLQLRTKVRFARVPHRSRPHSGSLQSLKRLSLIYPFHFHRLPAHCSFVNDVLCVSVVSSLGVVIICSFHHHHQHAPNSSMIRWSSWKSFWLQSAGPTLPYPLAFHNSRRA